MELLKGAPVSAAIGKKIKKELESWEGRRPALAIVRVGEKEDDISYELKSELIDVSKQAVHNEPKSSIYSATEEEKELRILIRCCTRVKQVLSGVSAD